jgi:hypothetical protein
MEKIRLKGQEIEILYEAQVAVCGGGPAGVASAVAAARSGTKTVLLEKALFAGGMTTGGMLPSIIHMSDGKNIVARGICKEVVDKATEAMGVSPNYHWQNIHPEILKIIYDEILLSSGVKVFYGIQVCHVIVENGRIAFVVVATPNGLKAVKSSVFIDATGDANIASWAGVPYEIGNSEGKTMAPTLCVGISGIDSLLAPQYNGLGRNEWKKALNENYVPVNEHHFVGFFKNSKCSGIGNLGHIYGMDCLDEDDLTTCCIQGRFLSRIYHKFFKQYVPGFATSELYATASQLGIRETRRIIGKYILNIEDYINHKHFDDDIGCLSYPIDIHASDCDSKKQKNVEKQIRETRYKAGENYGIPFRALVPLKISNLLVAGRCISTDRAMQSSVRIVPGCFVTGQAAGTAAAIACIDNVELSDLDINKLQRQLVKQGAFINGKN